MNAPPRFAANKPFSPFLGSDILEILNRQPVPATEVKTLSHPLRQQLLSELAPFTQLLDVPLENEPPKRPVGVKDFRLVELPENYQSPSIQTVQTVQPLEIPSLTSIKEIDPGKPLVFNVPIQNQSQFSVAQNDKAFMDPVNDIQANRLVSGGLQPSIIGKNWKAVWGIEKTCRDILQNFFDGHNGTLEGTSFKISKDKTTGKYNVMITGLGQYDYEKAYLLGGTSKAKDATKAGNYGEGLKVLSLNLLRDFGADSVRMASANWQMTYTLPESQDGEPKMFRHLELLKKPQDGNYLTFTTDRPELVEQLFKSLNYFYHPYNPDFFGTLIHTPHGGLAIYNNDKNRKGNVYLSRQRFAYEHENNWEGTLNGFTVWTNAKSIDKGRDRGAVHAAELNEAIGKIIQELPDNDLVHALQLLEKSWDAAEDSPLGHVIQLITSQMRSRKLAMRFDEKYYAGGQDRVSYDIGAILRSMGYEFRNHRFQAIGMTPLEQWPLYFANFKMIEPTPGEKQRLQILKKLMHEFILEAGQNAGCPIALQDVAKPVYIYDQGAQTGPDKMVEGRARFNATWLGNTTLREPLAKVFNVYAHELMHKHGDDGSYPFRRAYEAYIPMLTQLIATFPAFFHKMQAYEILWQETIEHESQASETEASLDNIIHKLPILKHIVRPGASEQKKEGGND